MTVSIPFRSSSLLRHDVGVRRRLSTGLRLRPIETPLFRWPRLSAPYVQYGQLLRRRRTRRRFFTKKRSPKFRPRANAPVDAELFHSFEVARSWSRNNHRRFRCRIARQARPSPFGSTKEIPRITRGSEFHVRVTQPPRRKNEYARTPMRPISTWRPAACPMLRTAKDSNPVLTRQPCCRPVHRPTDEGAASSCAG